MSFLKGRIIKKSSGTSTQLNTRRAPYQGHFSALNKLSSLSRLRKLKVVNSPKPSMLPHPWRGKSLWRKYFTKTRSISPNSHSTRLNPNPYRFSSLKMRDPYFFTFSKKKTQNFFYEPKSTYVASSALWAPTKRVNSLSFHSWDPNLLAPTSFNFLTTERVKSALSLDLTPQSPTPLHWSSIPRNPLHLTFRNLSMVRLGHLPQSFSFWSCVQVTSSEVYHKGTNTSASRTIRGQFNVRNALSLHKRLAAFNVYRKKKSLLYFSLYSYLMPSSLLRARASRTRIPELKSSTRGFYVTEQGLIKKGSTLTSNFRIINKGTLAGQNLYTLPYTSPILSSSFKRHASSLIQISDFIENYFNIRIKSNSSYNNTLLTRQGPVVPKLSLTKLSKKEPRRKVSLQKMFRRLRFMLRRPARWQRILRRRHSRFSRNYLLQGRRYYNSPTLRPRVRDYLRKKLRRFSPARPPRTPKLPGLSVTTQSSHVKDLINVYKKAKRSSQLVLNSLAYLNYRYSNLKDENSLISTIPASYNGIGTVSGNSTASKPLVLGSDLRGSVMNSFSSHKLYAIWSNPTLIKSSMLSYKQGSISTQSYDITTQSVKWALRLQNQLLSYLFGPNLTSLRKMNLWSVPKTNYTIRRKLLRLVLNAEFKADVATWFHSSLTRFVENCTGRKVALNFGPFVEGALTFWDHSMLGIWGGRISGFHKMLGHKIFAHEALMLVALSLRLKDPTFLANWIRSMLNRMSFWKYRVLFRYLKFLMRHLFFFSFPKFAFRGFKLRLKGKISVAGNARTRTLVLQVGDTSHSKMDNKVAYDLSYVNTFTGVLGFKLWFFY